MIKQLSATLLAIVLILSLSIAVYSQDKMQKEMKKEDKMGMMKSDKDMKMSDKEMKMGPVKSFSCDESCGFMARSHDEKEVTEMAMKHMKKHHHMNASEKEVKEMLKTEESGDMKK